MSRINRFALLLALAVTVSACGDDDTGGTTTTSAAGVTTTDGGTTTTTAGGGTTTTAGAAAVDPIDLDDLSIYLEPEGLSYRMTLVFHFVAQTDGGTIDGTQQVDGGKILDPPHFELTGRAEGDATGPQCFAFHTLPGFIDPYETFLDEGGMLMGEAALRESGIEVNGRIVDRYAITIDNIDPNDDSGSEVDDLTEAYIDIDRAGQFVVRLVLNGRGRSALLTGQPALVGEIDYALDFSEFGTITSLAAPEGC
ncbi:MAG: hypothetical protein AAB198_02265 [Actinomycetota bacterium]